jgi:hypothetical protein
MIAIAAIKNKYLLVTGGKKAEDRKINSKILKISPTSYHRYKKKITQNK